MAQRPRDAQKQMAEMKAEMEAGAKPGKGAAKKKAPVKEKADIRVMANFTQSMYDRLRARVREREDVWERGTPRPTLSLLIREAVGKMLDE